MKLCESPSLAVLLGKDTAVKEHRLELETKSFFLLIPTGLVLNIWQKQLRMSPQILGFDKSDPFQPDPLALASLPTNTCSQLL